MTWYAENWHHRIPKGQSKNGQHRETGNIRRPRRQNTSQKYNTICFRHHYAQTSTNNVYKTLTVDCVLVSAFSTPHTVLEYTNTYVCYIRRRQILDIKREIYTLKACVSKYNNYIACSFQLARDMSLLKTLTCDFDIQVSFVISQWSANHSTTPTSGNYFRTLRKKKIHCDYT